MFVLMKDLNRSEIIVLFFLFAEIFYCTKFPHFFFMWFGYQTEKKKNYSPNSSANKYVN